MNRYEMAMPPLLMNNTVATSLPVITWLGRQNYEESLRLQRRLHRQRAAGRITDQLLLLEHEPVYTLGRHADPANLLPDRPGDVPVVQTDRGGDVTYHGPGQLTGYPIMRLADYQLGVRRYVTLLEEALMELVATYGLTARRRDGLPGVWLDDRKVASIGIRLSRGITCHGFALNIAVPPRYLDGMIPCGEPRIRMGNLNDFLVKPTTPAACAGRITPVFHRLLGSLAAPPLSSTRFAHVG
ncbi:lipoyl(octanoyl) transferase LipB [Candidatus Neomarinimicrobiota bacterium]